MAPADVGLGGLVGGGLLLALLQLRFVEPRAQHVPGLRAVAVLRAVVLAEDHDVGRDMGQPDRGLGLVDVLAAGALARIVSMRTSDSLMSILMRSSITG